MVEHPHFPNENASGGGEKSPPGREPAPSATPIAEEPEWLAQQDIADDDDGFHQHALLQRLGLDEATIRHATSRSRLLGSTLEAELIALGYLTEEAFYRGVASYLGLAFRDRIEARHIIDREHLDTQLASPISIHMYPDDSGTLTAVAPSLNRLPLIAAWVSHSEIVRARLLVTTPSAIRHAVWEAGEDRRVRDATSRLFDTQPSMSSRQTLTGQQGYWIGLLIATAVATGFRSDGTTLELIHLLFAMLYGGTVLLRICSIPTAKKLRRPEDIDMLASPLPIYSVLVALYREAPVLPQLVQSLGRIDWPASRLDIKLVCEADDQETIEAIGRLSLPGHFEVVRVPPVGPRTKPKALTYALAGARGAYVTIYDAEDRPHPLQLREAHARFEGGDATLACLQAPIVISNGDENWLTTLFALEYAALFRALLPMLATYKLPMPLGGTSNHFRREVLVEACGWDPFNVTEDADLGTRLKRLGYQTEMLSCPTLEEAPSSKSVWLGQRGRWFKGWLQTALVSLRQPLLLLRQLKPLGFLVYLLTTVGMLASALIHPLLILLIGNTIWRFSQGTLPAWNTVDGFLMVIDSFNLVGGYACFLVTGRYVMSPKERQYPWYHYLTIPAYWFLLSYAAWRAFFEIRHSPHFWNKTPHTPVKRRPKKHQGQR